MHDYGWDDERVAVKEKPATENERIAAAKAAEDREASRFAERARVKASIEASRAAEAEAQEIASQRDTIGVEIESLKTKVSELEKLLTGDAGDDSVLNEQAAFADAIVKKQRQHAALHRRYIDTCGRINPTGQGDLFRLGRPDLVASATIRRRIAELLERGYQALQDDRGRFTAEQFELQAAAYRAELAISRTAAEQAARAVFDE